MNMVRRPLTARLRGRGAALAAAATALASVLGVGLAVGAAGAQAATLHTTSSNWAGYAVRRTGVSFKRVSGTWTVPAVNCSSSATSTYSANWVGLGGYTSTSPALEQLGTESDCSASGKATYSAWFEVVPAAATTAKLTIQPGDEMFASATVSSSKKVTLTIADTTRKTKVTKSVQAGAIDVSSAEWIVEAPALCSGSSTSDASCRQTALANFGSTTFGSARATTTGGHAGSILDASYDAIAISLANRGFQRGPGFVPGGGFGSGRGQGATSSTSDATPGAPSADGAAFTVSYGTGTAQ
jgi:hypothetical protein